MRLARALSAKIGYDWGSLEKGRKLLEQKGAASIHLSCLIVTGTVMLSLFSTATT